ncbi:nucleoside/nucleotide kinase family protein [Butyrivibrio sp. VCB2001]|uniref:nucleoside/nucleotide kinase family protein n=1 Tax=Butyrivibrio sp. VCB2001 TaxID=1280667 RepID=UPI000413EBEC|nr:nucleoside/nucleotide kinase family protein [Butyrivibrio sp. VCB2001]
MDYNININGIDVHAGYNADSIETIFRPLLLKLANMRKTKNKTLLVMLAAPPGAGKSTLVSFLEYLAKDIIPEFKVQAIGMDGFHRRQEYLIEHTTIVDGQEVRMVDVKGCPETFDLDKLRESIEDVLAGKRKAWPTYDRHLHNPVEDAIKLDADILLLEGNYLLLDAPGWDELSSIADYTIKIAADPEMLRTRLIDRKEKSGNSRKKAEQFVDYSDMRNVRLCLDHSKKADLELFLKSDNNYVEKKISQ